MFIDAFGRDEDFSDPCSQSAYLDLETPKPGCQTYTFDKTKGLHVR